MKLRYGLLVAMLFTAGNAIGTESTDGALPPAEKTNSGNAADATFAVAQQENPAPESKAAEPAQTTAAEEQSGFSVGSVVRSAFTTAVQGHEPVDKISELSTDTKKIYYFTELRDMSGQIAKHRWEYKGKVMAEVEFNVKGPRWRVWSSKSLVPQWTGEWAVSVLNGANEVIGKDTFQYIESTSQMPESAPESESAPAPESAPAGQ